MPIHFSPIGDKILLKPLDYEPSRSIIIPDVMKKGYRQEAEVVATPPFRIHRKTGQQYPFQVTKGQRVIHHPIHNDNRLLLDGEEFILLEERDIVGIIERTEAENKT